MELTELATQMTFNMNLLQRTGSILGDCRGCHAEQQILSSGFESAQQEEEFTCYVTIFQAMKFCLANLAAALQA